MSRWWNDRITLALFADGALLRRQARGQRQAELVRLNASPANGEELLLTVQRAIRERQHWRRPATLNVVLGLDHAKLALLPWEDDFSQREDRLAYARLSLRQQYGPAAADWDIRLSESAYGAPWLVAGVERSLIAGLDDLAAAFGWRLHALQPALMSVANTFSRRLQNGCVRLLLLDGERLLIARLEDGAWQGLRVRRIDPQRSDALPELLAQENLLDPDPVSSTSRLCLWSFFSRPSQLTAWRQAMIEVLAAPDDHPLLSQWKE